MKNWAMLFWDKLCWAWHDFITSSTYDTKSITNFHRNGSSVRIGPLRSLVKNFLFSHERKIK